MERLTPIEHLVGAAALGVSAVKFVVERAQGGAFALLAASSHGLAREYDPMQEASMQYLRTGENNEPSTL